MIPPGRRRPGRIDRLAQTARKTALAALVLLASCGTPDRPRPAGRGRVVSDAAVKVGVPYKAGGRTWVPADDRTYDVIGMASWYGAAHRGLPTANGERFDPSGISAAHTTLPLPSYVEVTALSTGRTIVLRINDRGPFAGGRIIDLSQGAARALGVERDGVARVRVRRVYPSEGDRAALRAGRPAAARPTVSGQQLAMLARRSGRIAATPAGAAATLPAIAPTRRPPVPAIASTRIPPLARDPAIAPVRPGAAPTITPPGAADTAGSAWLDMGGFDDPDRADAFASAAGSVGPAAVIGIGAEWRVRIGPFGDEASARSALARAGAAGYHDAHIVHAGRPESVR